MSHIAGNRLTEYPLFQGLNDAELERVAAVVILREIPADTTIIQEGEEGDELYLLDDGIVDISKTLTIVTSKHDFGDRERSFIRLSGTDHCYFGEMVLFGKGERSATVRAVTDCRLLVIGNARFRDLCESEPRIGYIVVGNIARSLADNLRKTNENVLKLTTALSLALSGEK